MFCMTIAVPAVEEMELYFDVYGTINNSLRHMAIHDANQDGQLGHLKRSGSL
jgi:hypothetical protein